MTAELTALEEARAHTGPPLRAALDRLDPKTRDLCGYHLGFWDDNGTPTESGGKGVRSALALLSARAAGQPAERGVPAAVACELVHNFSLLHDDVMDGDTERRHRATAWTVFGSSAAILGGDALLSLANEVLAEAESPTTAWAIRCLNATTRRLIAGQVADLDFESRDDVSLQECLAMAGDKTAALLACASSLGAVLADAPSDLALGLADFGEHLGLAFQLTDDLLGIWGSPERTGKPVLSDLRSRKKTVPVVAALESGTDAGRRLRETYLGSETLTEEQLQEVAALVEEGGGRAWVSDAVRREFELGRKALDGLELPEDVAGELDGLARQLSGRDR